MPETKEHKPIYRPLYAVTVHRCCAKGDLGEMKALAAEAEQLQEHGNLSAALEILKFEIARLEKK
jgi:Domain of unknown function (DUF1843)